MYADINTPGCHRWKIFEEGRDKPLGLVVAIDTDKGYILYYRMVPESKRIETVELPNGQVVPRVLVRFGKFRAEDRG